MSNTVWHATKMRLGRKLKSGKKELVSVLECATVQGLVVRTGTRIDTGYEGKSFPTFYSGQVTVLSTGHVIGPGFYGVDCACEFAAKIASVYDWDCFDPAKSVPPHVIAAINAELEPISMRNGAAYQEFLAEHRKQEDEVTTNA